ncbi:putative bifunctional diguanylate cyclase/phosphodiesterase [Roseomonas chloroacetimidivorans]|uniref:putative bifunctional diguanylate cyclase/phosphodiesterase n=1 Tax=Roseomonas chloroacetimidivorans TaxID=1766656 RepID=UPI003C747F44
MIQDLGDLESFRREFRRHVVLPLAAVLLVTVALGGFGLYWATRTSDTVSMEREARVTNRAVAASVQELTHQQQGAALWDPLITRLRAPVLDLDPLEENIGPWLFRMFGHEQVYILTPRGEPVYAAVHGQRVAPDRFTAVQADLKHLIAEMTTPAAVPSPYSSQVPVGDSDTLVANHAIYASDVVQTLGRPAAVSAMQIRPAGIPPEQDPGPDFVMVNLRFLDGPFLQEVADSNLIDGLRYSPVQDATAGEQSIPLADKRGARVGYLLWEPTLPGTKVLGILAPVTMAGTLIMVAMILMLARRLWRSGSQLSRTVLELRASEAHAQHLAFHDVLTGLANRALLDDRLEQALARVRRGDKLALMAVDLDRFKHVNDTLGHDAGDSLIKQFAARLAGLTRVTDTVARIGGDEFEVLQVGINGEEDVEVLCERVLEAVRSPFNLMGHEVFVGASIGVVTAPEAGVDRADLMRKADIALYRAKAEGRNCWRLFTPAMDETVQIRGEIEADLRQALSNGKELEVYYQPEVDASGQTIVGLEALVRWNHPRKGMLPPGHFIPIAEETGLIGQLGDWVLTEACRAAQKWPTLFMAVNVSPVQFQSPGFAEHVIELVRQCGCEPARIELEVTETVLLQDDEACRHALERLRAAGFRIALDDFGTGYSSLSHLRRFQVDKIKVDQSFTQNISNDADSIAIVEAVVTLGHAMGLTVTAEGVETAAQMNFLAAAGCNELQGYLFSQALSEEEISVLLQPGGGPSPEEGIALHQNVRSG